MPIPDQRSLHATMFYDENGKKWGVEHILNQLKVVSFNSDGTEAVMPLTAFGDLRTAELHPIFQGSFEYTVDNTDINSQTKTNDGTITQSNAMAVCSTSTTTNSNAMLSSIQTARYRAGLGGLIRFTALFENNVAGGESYIGIMDRHGSSASFVNGYTVGYDGTTFGFHRFQNDVKISVDQADWDDPLDGTGASGMTLDQTKINVFAIRYQYLGGGAFELFIENDVTGDLILVHRVNYTNKNTEPSTHNPNYRFHMHVDNNGTTTDLVLKCSSYAYFTEGKTSLIEIHQTHRASGEKQKTSVTAEVAILTIKNKATYISKTNFIPVLVEGIGTSIEANAANNLGNIRMVMNATLGGTPSYEDLNTANSVLEIDVAGTTVTDGDEIGSIALAGKNDRDFRPMENLKIILNAGDALTIAGSSANSATIKASMLLKELF